MPPPDAVIGSVPFADVEPEHGGKRRALHDNFFATSVDARKPDGVLALATSHFALDGQNAPIREFLAGRADVPGAIRCAGSLRSAATRPGRSAR